jgi:L-iditol 2-dehydrogenase
MSGHYNLCPDVEFLATPPYDGCLMDYISYPAQWAFPLPDNMSFEEGALVEPMAIGINAAKTGEVSLGQTVLVEGAGCIGLVSLMAAKAYGATTVFVADKIEKRLEKARELGGVAINIDKEDVAEAIMKATNGRGVDVVMDCAGFSGTVKTAVRVCRAGGQIVVVGMGADELDGIPLGPISAKELKITSIFRYKNLYPTTIAAIAGGIIDVNGIVSNRYPFEEAQEAYRDTIENIRDIVKGVITFD